VRWDYLLESASRQGQDHPQNKITNLLHMMMTKTTNPTLRRRFGDLYREQVNHHKWFEDGNWDIGALGAAAHNARGWANHLERNPRNDIAILLRREGLNSWLEDLASEYRMLAAYYDHELRKLQRGNSN